MFLSFLFIYFLGPHLWHMEVPRLEAQSEPNSCHSNADPHHSSLQCQNLNLSKVRDPACNLMVPSWSRFLCARTETPFLFFNLSIFDLQYCIHFWCIAKWFSYVYILFHTLFHYSLSQNIEYSFLCYTVGLCCLSTYIYNSLYLLIPYF